MFFRKFQPIFVVLLISSVFALTVTAQNRGRLVEVLDIQGNRRLKDVDLLEHIKTRPGDLFDEKQVEEDLKSLLTLGLFNKRNTRLIIEEGARGGVNVIFEVNELPLIVEVDFGCLKFVTKEELIGELRAQNVKIESGEVYAPENFSKARQIILEYLAKRGLPEAKAEVYEEVVSATSVKLGFHIKEIPCENEDCSCEN
jgi:outer membrane protein assembly factor BamA